MAGDRKFRLRRVRQWLARNHSSVRDWLVLVAAVLAAFLGWQQIADERDARKDGERQAAIDDEKAQAEQIAAWIALDRDSGMDSILINRSDQPVYQVVVYRVVAYGAGPHTGREVGEAYDQYETFSTLPPGEYKATFGPGFAGMSRKPGAEIAFRDQAGTTWVRTADGILTRSAKSPVDFYGLSESQAWEIPEPMPGSPG